MSDDQGAPNSPTKPTRMPALVPIEKTAVLPEEKAMAFLRAVCFYQPTEITGYWTPATSDLVGVEAGLEKYLEEQGRKPHADWSRYFRQVAGLVQAGERTLFLSYFVIEADARPGKPADAGDSGKIAERWTQEPFWINDGGEIYFRVIYELKKREFSWYERNGDA